VNGFVVGQVLVIGIGNLNGAIPDTGVTPRADVLDDITRFFDESDVEVSGFSFDTLNFCVC